MFASSHSSALGQVYYLTDVLGAKVLNHGKRIGRLADIVIVESNRLPEVTKLFIRRPYGDASLMIPWDKVKVFQEKEIVISVEDLKQYEKTDLSDADVLLKDHVLDKKVLDIEDREVEIVYDVKLIATSNKLLVTEANISRYRFLRRLGLKPLANFFYGIQGKKKDRKIPWTYIQPLPPNIGSFKGDVKLKVLKEALADIHPADLADIIEELDHTQRLAVFGELDTERASDTLEEIDPSVQRELIGALKKEQVAHLLSKMTPGQAADVLSVLPHTETKEILDLLRSQNHEATHKIEGIIGKQDERIANFTTPKVLKQTVSASVQEAQDYFHLHGKDAEVIMYLYITDDADRLLGVMDLRELLQAAHEKTLKDVMIDNVITLNPKSTLKDALDIFSRYDFRAIPVIDEERKLLGAVPFRDVMGLKHKFLE
ncbi:MAG: CBS domain-containing protein [Candidatus Peribacteraceae bacterium]|nr:CBS domain-containing protein [Candidatus Peribacteraceae bacterium]MDD5074619.1 CBS domain-containing protein [Candidatus Peribacteraceae bacterium]